jgi:hypothetical protein
MMICFSFLSSSNDPFHLEALKAYLQKFQFQFLPIDLSIRLLLYHCSLPKETQHIDRFIEAFSNRYCECNPEVFPSPDKTYILAFSIIMLHTDWFNKNNKKKMTKEQYIKNTKVEGVGTEILEYVYDQIIYAPFVFGEDESDMFDPEGLNEFGLGGTVLTSLKGASLTTIGGSRSAMTTTLTNSSEKNKLDPIHLLTQAPHLIQDLKVDVESIIPYISPFCFTGTLPFLDVYGLYQTFLNSPLLPLIIGGGKEIDEVSSFTAEEVPTSFSTVTVKVNKIGWIDTKEDLLEGGKKANTRKWIRWLSILTGSR